MKVKNDHRSELENLLRWSFFTYKFCCLEITTNAYKTVVIFYYIGESARGQDKSNLDNLVGETVMQKQINAG